MTLQMQNKIELHFNVLFKMIKESSFTTILEEAESGLKKIGKGVLIIDFGMFDEKFERYGWSIILKNSTESPAESDLQLYYCSKLNVKKIIDDLETAKKTEKQIDINNYNKKLLIGGFACYQTQEDVYYVFKTITFYRVKKQKAIGFQNK